MTTFRTYYEQTPLRAAAASRWLAATRTSGASGIKVLFTGLPVDIDGHAGKAEAVYFVSKAGAKVFSSGTIRWALGLGAAGYEREQFKTFNSNLLKYFL